jgi:geranylgeranyl diphosphate synthase, type II
MSRNGEGARLAGVESLAPYMFQAKEVCEAGLARFAREGQLTCSIRQALEGGKRLRAALVLMSAGGEAANEAALAVEDFHAASLIADDLPCMDDAEERRGKPALHRAFDEQTALLASYALISAGYEQLALGARRLDRECGLLSIEMATRTTGIEGLIGGQDLDLQGAHTRAEELLAKKTGSLFELSIGLGWLYGGGDLDHLPNVRQFGRSLGIVFQLLDDRDDCDDGAFNVFSAPGEGQIEHIFGDARAQLRSGLDTFFAGNRAVQEMVEGMLERHESAKV